MATFRSCQSLERGKKREGESGVSSQSTRCADSQTDSSDGRGFLFSLSRKRSLPAAGVTGGVGENGEKHSTPSSPPPPLRSTRLSLHLGANDGAAPLSILANLHLVLPKIGRCVGLESEVLQSQCRTLSLIHSSLERTPNHYCWPSGQNGWLAEGQGERGSFLPLASDSQYR